MADPGYVIAVGKLKIEVDRNVAAEKAAGRNAAKNVADEFNKSLVGKISFARAFSGGTNNARRAGKDAGDAYADAFRRQTNGLGGALNFGNLGGLGSALSGITSALGGVTQSLGQMAGQMGTVNQNLGQVSSQLGQMGGQAGSAASSLGSLGAAGGIAGALLAGMAAVVGGLFTSIAVMNVAAVASGAILSALAAAAGAVGGALAALPGILGGVAAGLGAVLFVAKPLMEAFQAFTAEQNAATQSSQRAAKAQTSNAAAIKAATNAIADAKRQQARTTVNGAEQIKNAEKRVTEANEAALDAQKDLNDARKEAARDIENLKQKQQDLNASMLTAGARVMAAEEKLAGLRQQAFPDALKLAEAEAELAEAKAKQSSVALDQKQNAEDVAKANKSGVEGQKKVIDATERAAYAAEKAKEAEDNLKKTKRDAAQANEDAARQVGRAQDQLDQANIKVGQSTGAVTTGQSKLASALAKLSPAGLAFLDVIKQYVPVFDGVSKAIQERMLPALTPLATTVRDLFGYFKDGQFVLGPLGQAFANAGTQIGKLGTQFDKMLKGEAGKAIISLVNTGAKAIGTLGSGLLTMLDKILPSMAKLGEAAGPVMDAFKDGFGVLGDGLKGFFDELSRDGAMKGFASGIKGMFKLIGGMLPLIGKFIGKLAEIGGPYFEKMSDTMLSVLGTIFDIFTDLAEGGVIKAFTDLFGIFAAEFKKLVDSGVIKQLGAGFSDIMRSLGPMIPALVQTLIPALPGLITSFVNLTTAFNDLLPQLMPLVGGFMKFIELTIDFFVPMMPDLIGLMVAFGAVLAVPALAALGVVEVLTLLVAGIRLLITWVADKLVKAFNWAKVEIPKAWNTIKEKLGQAWTWIKENVFYKIRDFVMITIPGWFKSGVGFIKTKWDGFKEAINGAWSWVKKTVFTPIQTFITKTVPGWFSSGVTAIKTAWEKVKEAAKTPVKFMVNTVFNEGLVPLWNNIIAKIPGVKTISKLALPKGFASGGVLPGNSGMRGVDDRLATVGGHTIALAGGEMVVNAKQTKKNRGVLEAINSGMDIPGFAKGGWLGNVGGWFKDRAKDAGSWVRGQLGKPVTAALDALVRPAIGMIPQGYYGNPLRDLGFNTANKIESWVKGDDKKNANGPIGEGGYASALEWAKSQAGKPYIWASSGPNGYDCSGFMSAILNVIQGKNPYSRRFSSGDAGGPSMAGMTLNKQSPFMVGAVHGNPGHVAGTLNGVNVESTGSAGVRVGKSARGWNDSLFRYHYGLAKGGVIGDLPFDILNRKGKQYNPFMRATLMDNGGVFAPGSTTLVKNATSETEAALTMKQLRKVSGTHIENVNITVNGDGDPKAIASEVITAIKNIDTYATTNPS